MNKSVAITGVQLGFDDKDAVVWIQVNGTWVEVLRGSTDGLFRTRQYYDGICNRLRRAGVDTGTPKTEINES